MTSSRQKTELPIDEQLGLNTLGVEYHVDNSVMSLITKNVSKAGKLVVNEIRKELSNGLPISEVALTRLDDRDAGQWPMIIFQVKVELDTKAENEAWDRIIDRIVEARESQGVNKGLREALSDKIGVHMRWL